MIFTCWFKCLIIFLAYFHANGEQQIFGRCGRLNRLRKRIVGGERVSIRYNPWFAELREEPDFIICGAAIIHPLFVLTSAHCFKWELDAKIIITFGTDKLEFKPENYRRNVKFIRYPKYNRDQHHDDIMLIKLDKPINFTSEIQPICLPKQNEELNAPEAEVVGFGRKSYTGDFRKTLHAIDLKIVSNSKCSKVFKDDTIFATNICAGGESGIDACQGDSGAPMVLKTHEIYTVIGVVSWGHRCALEGIPGIYTRISSYVDWIVDTIKNEIV